MHVKRFGWVAASALVLVSSACLAQPTPASASASAPATFTRVIVQMKPPAEPGLFVAASANPAAHIAAAHSASDVQAPRPLGIVGLATAEVSPAGLKALQADPKVLRVVQDRLSRPNLLETVHMVGADAKVLPQSGLSGGSGQVIAVLDTGVNTSHAFLAGKVIDEACFSTAQSATYKLQSLCSNGLEIQIGKGAAADCDGAIAGCGHGTHVTGIAVGGPINYETGQIRGVAPAARVIALKVYTRFDDPEACGALGVPCVLSFTSDQLRALDYVLRLSAKLNVVAVNMSLGSGSFSSACPEDALVEPVHKLAAKRIATIVASGNDALLGSVSSPACVPGVITVGAIDKHNALAVDFSNTSELVALLAPGDHVLSAARAGGFVYERGTSMATPHVAGAWAVLRQAWPDASVADILTALKRSGSTIVDARTGSTFAALRVNTAMSQLPKKPKPAQTAAPLAEFANAPPAKPASGASSTTAAPPAAPTRIIVQLPETAPAMAMSASALSSHVRSSIDASMKFVIRDRTIIIEDPKGIPAETQDRLRSRLGSEKIYEDRLSRPLK